MKVILAAVLCALSISVWAHDMAYYERMQEDSSQKIFSSRTTFPLDRYNRVQGVPRNTIYITIDDGPTPKVTEAILSVLKRYNVRATFFVVGRNAKAYPHIMRAEYNDGHAIGSHSYNHELDFPNNKSFYDSLVSTNNVIFPYQANTQIELFRAPGGVWNSWRAELGNAHESLRKMVGPIYWNAGGGNPKKKDDADWKCWSKGVSARACANSYLAQIRSNYNKGTATILLMHDIKMQSAQMLEMILSELSQDSINWNFDLIEDIPAVQDAR